MFAGSALVRSRRVYWTAVVLLLLPLATFWVGVITRSESISRLLFGSRHTALRDLLPTVLLPAVALLLSVARLRVSTVDETERNVIRAVIATLATSYVVMLVYLIAESAPRR